MPRENLGGLPPDLAAVQCEIEGFARQGKLDFFPVLFEVVDYDQLNSIAAYGGFPTRYPHWRFGMEYEQLSKGYAYGLQKIYELVINNDPCYAYLMKSNTLGDQKMVMAHVYGHCDFFKNNAYFAHTDRKMMDHMANHGNRIRRYMDRFGVEEVETFIDYCLSIEDLIDIHSTYIKRNDPLRKYDFPSADDEEPPTPRARFPAKEYMDQFINPQGLSAAPAEIPAKNMVYPTLPSRDVMLFLMEHAPLKPWQADTLSIIRDEAYYFAPQAQTKIMNEGWASFWHSTIMTRQGLTPGEVVNYCDHHSGTMATSGGRLNPYKLGLELFRDIESRWNRGQHGPEWEECDDHVARQKWDTGAGAGRNKIFEVRKVHNDLTFIDSFLTLDFCREQNLFSFGFNAESKNYEIESREFEKIKQRLLFNLTNRGQPLISIVDANHKNRGELLLQHDYSGVGLNEQYAFDTLFALYQLWSRPVRIMTVENGVPTLLSFDGHERKKEAQKQPAAKGQEK